ncbi:MAG: peptidase T [Gaiellaceae bacterium]
MASSPSQSTAGQSTAGQSPAGRAPFATSLAEELAADVLDRFLRYVRVDTQSDVASTTYPSTVKQLDLSRLLVAELRAIGLEDARLTDYGYVFATLPGAVEEPVVGLLAHVDTSTECSGEGVVPLLHESYDGRVIVLPGDPNQTLDPSDTPELAARVGHDIVTSDGTTLLGADDKAGVAEIMAAVAWLARHPEVPHAPLRIGFTVDEEVSRGTLHFDLEEFEAELAYTLDGSGFGVLESESFSAKEVVITIHGRGTHPGTAKGKLVNSLKLAADLIAGLPRDGLSPETTEGREGFVHPSRISGTAEETRLTLIARDHDDERLEEHIALLRRLADDVVAREPRARVDVDVEFQYPNMGQAIEKHPRVVAAAVEAYRRIGVQAVFEPIRGGTDGSRLSAAGLPTPNLFTGGQDYHSVREWASVQDMAAAAAMVVELVQIWAEPTA